MKQRIYLFAGALALAITAGAAYVGTAKAATSNLTVDAVLVQPITINCGTPIDFANLYNTPADTITISTAGARTEGAGADNIAPGGTPNAGICSIDGTDGAIVDLNIPDDTVTDGTDVLEVDNFTVAGGAGVVGGPNDFDLTLGVSGVAEDFSIGADLTIGAGDDPGTYTGTITVTAAYQ